jgi:hypothetical protein
VAVPEDDGVMSRGWRADIEFVGASAGA